MGGLVNTATLNQGLSHLRQTDQRMEVLEQRIATGRVVNTAKDDPARWAIGRTMSSRVGELAVYMDLMAMGQNAIKVFDRGLESMHTLLDQAKGLAIAADGASATDRSRMAQQFNTMLEQIDELAADTRWGDRQVLRGDSHTIALDRGNSVEISGVDFSAAGLGVQDADWSDAAAIETSVQAIETAMGLVRDKQAELGSKAAIIETRSDFTETLSNSLSSAIATITGEDRDMEHTAELKALEVRRTLQVEMVAVTMRSAELLLRLFR